MLNAVITSFTIEVPFDLFMYLVMQPKYLTDGNFYALVAECEKQK